MTVSYTHLDVYKRQVFTFYTELSQLFFKYIKFHCVCVYLNTCRAFENDDENNVVKYAKNKKPNSATAELTETISFQLTVERHEN